MKVELRFLLGLEKKWNEMYNGFMSMGYGPRSSEQMSFNEY
jgi:hypothetical protein